jgi:hypothetical protein
MALQIMSPAAGRIMLELLYIVTSLRDISAFQVDFELNSGSVKVTVHNEDAYFSHVASGE